MIQDISVIICLKEEEEIPYLKDLLEQLCRQTDRYRLQIIIATSSSDIDKKIIEIFYKLKEKFEYVPPVKYLQIIDGSINQLRNEAATSIDNQILVFLDVDNIFSNNPWNGDNNIVISDLITPLVNGEYVMTYIPTRYDLEQGKTLKEKKLIKYNNFLLRFDIVPKPPFAIMKDSLVKAGGFYQNNTFIVLSGKILLKYPGGIKKIETSTALVSPRHIIERANKKKK